MCKLSVTNRRMSSGEDLPALVEKVFLSATNRRNELCMGIKFVKLKQKRDLFANMMWRKQSQVFVIPSF